MRPTGMRNLIRSAALLTAGAALGSGLTSLTAQTSKVTPIPPPSGSSVASDSADARPIVPSTDLALRVEGRKNGRVVGTLMTKLGDEWVEVQLASRDSSPKAP